MDPVFIRWRIPCRHFVFANRILMFHSKCRAPAVVSRWSCRRAFVPCGVELCVSVFVGHPVCRFSVCVCCGDIEGGGSFHICIHALI